MLVMARGIAEGAGGLVTDGLGFHVNINDASSYGGSGQTVSDISSNSYDMYLGATSGAEATDPTYAAGPPAYLSTDGGDYLKQISSATGSIVQTFGRQDTEFSLEFVMYWVAGNSAGILSAGAGGSGGDDGCGLLTDGSGNLYVYTNGGIASAVYQQLTRPSSNAWHHCALTGQHDGSTCRWYVDGTQQDTYTKNETAWVTGDANTPLYILARNNGSVFAPSGFRFGCCRLYTRALTADEVSQNFAIEDAIYSF